MRIRRLSSTKVDRGTINTRVMHTDKHQHLLMSLPTNSTGQYLLIRHMWEGRRSLNQVFNFLLSYLNQMPNQLKNGINLLLTFIIYSQTSRVIFSQGPHSSIKICYRIIFNTNQQTIIQINNQQDMIYIHLLFALLFLGANSAVVVNQITGITTKNLMYTGTIEVGSEKLFFTFYGIDGETNADNLKNNPLVISVGTPGRSAQYINLGGIGPKVVNIDNTLSDNSNRVTQFANAMFLDSLGSGFSFASSGDALPKTASQHGTHLSTAINSFIAQSNIGGSDSVYIIGESNFARTLPGLKDINQLKGIIYVSAWFDLIGVGSFYSSAGIEMKIFTNSQKTTIDATFSTCSLSQRNGKFADAHACYDSTLNYIENKTKSVNLYNIKRGSNLTEVLPQVHYYFSLPATVNAYKAPNGLLFEAHSYLTIAKLFEDYGRNIDASISTYLKNYLSVKQIFLTGDDDFITYRKGTRNWLENTLTFVDSAKFKPLNLTEYKVFDKVVGYRKSVPQVGYYELLDSGHFIYKDQPNVLQNIIKELVVAPSEKQHLQVETE